MSITEKLGITDTYSKKWEAKYSSHGWWSVLFHDGKGSGLESQVVNKEVADLIVSAPEMLDALVEDLIKTENEGWCEVCENHVHSDNCKKLMAVEKAIGKSWYEIKEVLK